MSRMKMWQQLRTVAGLVAGLMSLTRCGGVGEGRQELVEKEVGAEAPLESCQQVVRYEDLVLTSIQDGYVVAAQPDASFGGATALLVDGDPRMEAYLSFSLHPSLVQGVTITQARLQLYAFDGSSDGPALYRAGTGWSADTLTWNTRPATVGGVVGDLGAVTSNSQVEYDVASVVTGAGTYGFALVPTGGNGVDFRSNEWFEMDQKPRLIVTVARTFCERQGSGGEFVWAWPRGGEGYQQLEAMAMDPSGGFVIAATYSGQVNLGGQTLNGPYHVALAKYAPDGAHQWSRLHVPIANGSSVFVSDLTLTPLGNILMVGTYHGAPNFGAGPLPTAGGEDTYGLFIAKFSPTGSLVWARGFVPSGDGGAQVGAGGRAVATDANGSLIVTGVFTGWLNLGGETLQSGETFSQEGMFLAKYSWEGEHLWSLAVPAGTSNPWSDGTVSQDVLTNGSGQIFVAGHAGTGRLGATGDQTPFVASYSPEGTQLWARALNGADGTVESLALLPSGSVAFGGYFSGSFTFAGATVAALPDSGGLPARDGLLGVLSASGSDAWARRLGSNREEAVLGIATDATGGISIRGFSSG
ncbi:DNRLRE domain-containing protein [Pyxidicoccus sp. 3LG]